MCKRIYLAGFLWFCSLVYGGLYSVSQATTITAPTGNVLILYDASSSYDPTGEYGWIGNTDGLMLTNLLGHFNYTSTIEPVTSYNAGDMNKYSATFYFGNEYGATSSDTTGHYAAFMHDVMTTTKPICWVDYNIWDLIAQNSNFVTKFGFTFNKLDESGYPKITYRGIPLVKSTLDPEMANITITNPALATTVATATSATGVTIPYIIRSSNFWYVADQPFSYISANDRYLAFADILYDILGVTPASTQKIALLRLEDIDPTYDLTTLKKVTDWLYSQKIPFAVAVIPTYTDPTGFYNNGVPLTVNINDNTAQTKAFVQMLGYMVSKGGIIIDHGYTHQYSNVPNAFTGVSADDNEFFRVTENSTYTAFVDFYPTTEDNATVASDTSWVAGRITKALNEFSSAITAAKPAVTFAVPTIWETPHYAASGKDSQYFATRYKATYGQVLYFDTPTWTANTHVSGQFFPYVIYKDIYGQKIIPENLGDIETQVWYGYPKHLPTDIILAARSNLASRAPVASMYFHPFNPIIYLQLSVLGIKLLGYTFVSPNSL